MQATTATFRAGGSGSPPLSNFSAYASLFLSSSSVWLMQSLSTVCQGILIRFIQIG